MPKLSILTFVNGYLPGYKAGGTLRHVASLVDWLGCDCSFHVVTRDRDSGDVAAYHGIASDKWTTRGSAEVYYASRKLTHKSIADIAGGIAYDILYLNSFFSPQFSVLPATLHKLKTIRPAPMIIHPHGEFSQSALGMKPTKKRLFLHTARALGLHHGARWQASSVFEMQDIHRAVGNCAEVAVVPNLPPCPTSSTRERRKHPNDLRIAFLGRLSPMKNLELVFDAVAHIPHSIKVTLDIYGPSSDARYSERCRGWATNLPGNAQALFHGPLPHDKIQHALTNADVLFMPSLSENYCYSIIEAWQAGIPVLISDRTPWRQLEKQQLGWDFPLTQREDFVRALTEVSELDESRFAEMSQTIREKVAARLNGRAAAEHALNFFKSVARSPS